MRDPNHAALAVIALVVLLYLPALGVGLTADDAWWVLSLDQGPEVGPYDVNFGVARDFWSARGLDAWWAGDTFRWVLWRPLAVALMKAEWAVFGNSRVAWQAVSVLGYAGLVAACWPLYRRLLSPAVALGALLVFGVQISHIQTVWFMSNSHGWLAAIPTVGALLAWIRWRDQGWRPGLWLAALGVGLGLACSETALGGVAYLIAYEWTRLPRSRVALIGLLAAVGLFVLVYGALGYGTAGSELYLDPRRTPVAFALAGLTRAPALVAGALGVMPAELWIAAPRLRGALAVAGLGGALWLALLLGQPWARRWEADRRALGWLVPGAGLSLLPVLGAPPGGRLVLWATLGTAAAVSLALNAAWQARRRREAGALLAAPIGLAVVLGALGTPLQLRNAVGMADGLRAAADEAEIDDDRIAEERLVVLNMPEAFTAFYLLPTRLIEHHAPAPASWTVLSTAPHDISVVRALPDGLRLTVLGGHLWEQPFDHLLGATPGPTWRRGPVTATVQDNGDQAPDTVMFTFDPPLSAPGWRFLAWRDGTLRRVELPGPGQELILPWSPSPFPSGR